MLTNGDFYRRHYYTPLSLAKTKARAIAQLEALDYQVAPGRHRITTRRYAVARRDGRANQRNVLTSGWSPNFR